MEDPLVSIIIPTYNRSQLIGETLQSVLAQTYQYWECIVVDDGSKDNTIELIKTYIERDSRIKVYKRPANQKKGASSCRNYGLEKSKGEFIQFLDSDDLIAENKLQEQVKICKGDYTLLTCKWGGFENPKDLKSRFKKKYHSYRNFRKPLKILKIFGEKDEFFPPHTYLIPKKLIDKAGSWNEELTNNDDAEFFTRIILSAKRIKFTPNTAVYYRYSGSDKLSSITSIEKAKSAIKSWKLIESHLKNEQANFALVYVDNAKRFLSKNIKNNFPEIVEEGKLFFQSKSSSKSFMQDSSKIKLLLERNKFNRSR